MYREALLTEGSRYIFIKPLSLFYKNTRTDGSVGSRLLPRSSLRVFWLKEVVSVKNSYISQNVSRSLVLQRVLDTFL